jgi:hypothetical protein
MHVSKGWEMREKVQKISKLQNFVSMKSLPFYIPKPCIKKIPASDLSPAGITEVIPFFYRVISCVVTKGILYFLARCIKNLSLAADLL